jgi:hypothetical protein
MGCPISVTLAEISAGLTEKQLGPLGEAPPLRTRLMGADNGTSGVAM